MGKLIILVSQIFALLLSIHYGGTEAGHIYAAAQFICCAILGLALVIAERR